MRMYMYAVRDRVAMAYIGGVQLFANDAVAVRMFGDVAGEPKSIVGAHVGDHELHAVGVFDTQLGVVLSSPVEFQRVDGGADQLSFFQPRVVITGEAWLASQARGPERVESVG